MTRREKMIAITAVFPLILILLTVSDSYAVVTLPFSGGFENYSINQAPPLPWFSEASLDGVVTNQTSHSGSKSLVLGGGPFWSESAVVDLGTLYSDNLSYEGFIKFNSSVVGHS